MIDANGPLFKPPVPTNPTSYMSPNLSQQGDFSKVLSSVSANVVAHLRKAEDKEKSDLKTDKVKKVVKKTGDDTDPEESIHHVVLGLNKTIKLLKTLEDE